MAWNINGTQMGPCIEEVNNTKVVPTEEAPFQDLVPLLRRAATDDKTIIMTSVNGAWAAPNSLLDVFLESFHIGEQIEHLLQHLIIVAMDPKAFKRCKSLHPHCYLLKVNGTDFTSEKVLMSKGYIELVWSKLKFQRRILELGYNFLFTDIDVLWFRNPFKHTTVLADLTTSCDFFFGDPKDLANFPNTGLFYVKSTRKNAEMLKCWYESKARFPNKHEQSVFNKIKRELIHRFRVRFRFIPTDICGGFCSHGKDLSKICTMHANCCVGLQNKLHDLRNVMEDWKTYMALSTAEERRVATWRVPTRCII
ncbi:uncharacterized protein At4g15970-like [Typha latifolia]|uniref:uncharacterized protein At4g15970-like n=1 Tax=Typha latifolia TaxID=4733 RepID=UPI003C306810